MNLPQRDEKRWEWQAVDGKGQDQVLPMTSLLVLLLALDGGLQLTGGGGGFRHQKKGKDFNINYHKVIERSFFPSLLSNAVITRKLKHV